VRLELALAAVVDPEGAARLPERAVRGPRRFISEGRRGRGPLDVLEEVAYLDPGPSPVERRVGGVEGQPAAVPPVAAVVFRLVVLIPPLGLAQRGEA